MGYMMPLGKGMVYSFYTKQKMNWKKPTEENLIGVDEATVKTLWSKYFIQSQGYNLVHKKPFQENKSSILLEKW